MTGSYLYRRDLLSALGAGAFFLLPELAKAQAVSPVVDGFPAEATGPAEAFSFDKLKEIAQGLAHQAYTPLAIPEAAILDQLDFDNYQKIHYKSDDTLWAAEPGHSPVQLFFPGKYFKSPVHIYAVRNGMAREVPFSLDLFDIPDDSPAKALTQTQGFAGFRAMNEDMKSDWMAFLGASYWRTSGFSGQYGLSVRGLALDTAIPNGPEEFPNFTRFWLEPGDKGALTIYALLESPRATGAYRIASHQDNGVIQDIDASIYLRGDVSRLGIAPLTSMYWYSEHDHFEAPDWRPEVHDSDGLQILSGNGERIWRPLNNPPRTMSNTFWSPGVQGFGLMQRDRNFDHYQDDGVFYDRRASAWIEPKGNWGEGSVTLVEITTDDEIHDNIVAFWTPAAAASAGNSYDISYRLTWMKEAPIQQTTGRYITFRLGAGGIPGQPRPKDVVKIVADFDGFGLDGLGRGDGVTVEATASAGTIGNSDAYPVVGETYWRAMFDLDFSALDEKDDTPIDLRVFVSHDKTAKTETLILQLFPSQLRRYLAQHA